ncbi:hypothetical protein [Leptospira kmetyi]|uniref:Uncharacterized protein n=1 Tax=Leptospira kmetyi TaxID=408139 RepID=A0ABX4NAE6_9LEPT|nr:hypothetical protein [Leptospira kmetyi]PJZ28385.1 hypothetical protein CH378_18070 [Leptospira kmetyi]
MNKIESIIESDKIYLPWLIDLAYLEENFIEKKNLSLGYTLRIPSTDFTEHYLESVPYPQLITTLVITISYLEKGLKYLLLICSAGETYDSITNYNHHLRKIYDKLILVFPDFGKNFTPKVKGLFLKLTNMNYTTLRYLHKDSSIKVSLKVLKDLIISFKLEVILFRRDNLYLNEVIHKEMQNNHSGDVIKISWGVLKVPPKKISIWSFKKIISGKSLLHLTQDEKGNTINADDRRLSDEERSFIEESYELQENSEYILKSNLGLRTIIRLSKLLQKVDFTFANFGNPTLLINR